MNSRVLVTLADNSKVGVKLGIKYANVFLKVVVKATYICPNGVRNRRVPLYIYNINITQSLCKYTCISYLYFLCQLNYRLLYFLHDL